MRYWLLQASLTLLISCGLMLYYRYTEDSLTSMQGYFLLCTIASLLVALAGILLAALITYVRR